MTRAERNNKLKHFITCLKCEVNGKPCDVNCPTQYDAGNMGEIIENLETISKALEQESETVTEFADHCREYGAKYGKLLKQEPMRDATPEERESVDKYVKSISKPTGVNFEALEQEPCDVFDEYGNYKYPSDVELTEPNTATSMPSGDLIRRQAVYEMLDSMLDDSSDNKRNQLVSLDSIADEIAELPSVNPQEPKYCDRNICIQNEYNGIGCDECEVTKSQEPTPNDVLDKIRNEFIAQYPRNHANELELGGRSCVFSLNEILRIIDKYRAESEEV